MPLVISFQHAVDLVRLGLPTLSHLWQAATQLSGHTSSPQLQAAVSLPCACVVSGSVRLGWSSSTEFRPPLLRVVPHFLIVTMAPGSPFGFLRPKIGQAFHWGCTHTHTHTHTHTLQPGPVLWPELKTRKLPPSSKTQPPLPALGPSPHALGSCFLVVCLGSIVAMSGSAGLLRAHPTVSLGIQLLQNSPWNS